jgi:hypothetical protein
MSSMTQQVSTANVPFAGPASPHIRAKHLSLSPYLSTSHERGSFKEWREDSFSPTQRPSLKAYRTGRMEGGAIWVVFISIFRLDGYSSPSRRWPAQQRTVRSRVEAHAPPLYAFNLPTTLARPVK